MRFVIIGGGPAGNQAATHAAMLGVDVTLIERDIIGGAANLWDCIPSKAMIATGGAMSYVRQIEGMGVTGAGGEIDLELVRHRITRIVDKLSQGNGKILRSQDVELVRGTARMVDDHTVAATTTDGERTFHADAVLPDHVVVIGSGVTGVEFVHLFSALGCEVTLIVSRQQVLPQKDPEVASVLESDFTRRGVRLLKGARAVAVERTDDSVVVRCDDGRVVTGSHALLAIGSIPNSEGLELHRAGVEVDEAGYVTVNRHCQTNVPHIFAAGDGRWPTTWWAGTPPPTAIPTTRVPRRPSSPTRRSPTSVWPKPTPSPKAARSG
jgi:dihydrolipoamide dehydrogenase